jgi:hypothetical protein
MVERNIFVSNLLSFFAVTIGCCGLPGFPDVQNATPT